MSRYPLPTPARATRRWRTYVWSPASARLRFAEPTRNSSAQRLVGPETRPAQHSAAPTRPNERIRRAGRNGRLSPKPGHESLKRHCDELASKGHDDEMAPAELSTVTVTLSSTVPRSDIESPGLRSA